MLAPDQVWPVATGPLPWFRHVFTKILVGGPAAGSPAGGGALWHVSQACWLGSSHRGRWSWLTCPRLRLTQRGPGASAIPRDMPAAHLPHAASGEQPPGGSNGQVTKAG